MDETRTVTVERQMPHPPEKVWRALTQGALMADWLMANDFEPEVGRAFELRGKSMPPHWDGVVRGEVIEVSPVERLAYGWRALGVDTVVRFTLTAVAGGTLLRMEQSGFTAAQEQNYRGAQFGWTRNLEALERVLGEIE